MSITRNNMNRRAARSRAGWLAAAMAAGALLCTAPAMAQDVSHMVRGRTGLPTVREGEGRIWMERGVVNMNVRDDQIRTVQTFRLQYPGPPLEHDPLRAKIAVREDFFRKGEGKGDVTLGQARGFSSFAVWIDGQRVPSEKTSWELNDARDTATRWRNFRLDFRPGQRHYLRIVSVAPVGWQGAHPVIDFVSKDLGHWRGVPDYLELKVSAPGTMEARVDGIEPKPTNVSAGGIRWVYRKAVPDRDVFVMLPPGSRSAMGR
ncbi:MAG: hypothetical protein IT208_13275 [Chthonomonadales bacterium]|nr:hypothetical protein [Chthonomonadales bacterium]